MPGLFPSNWQSAPQTYHLNVLCGLSIILLTLSADAPTAHNCLFTTLPFHARSPADLAAPLLLYATGAQITSHTRLSARYHAPLLEVAKLLAIAELLDGAHQALPPPRTRPSPRAPGVLRRVGLAALPLAYLSYAARGRPVRRFAFFAMGAVLVAVYLALAHTLHTCDAPELRYEPHCNAGLYIDFKLRGMFRTAAPEENFYRGLAARRCGGEYSRLPKYDAWLWFDPYGLLGSINAAVTVLIGGLVETAVGRMSGLQELEWAVLLATVGWAVEYGGVSPVRRELYSTSYMFLVTAVVVVVGGLVKWVCWSDVARAVFVPCAAIGSRVVWMLVIAQFDLVGLLLRSVRLSYSRTLLEAVKGYSEELGGGDPNQTELFFAGIKLSVMSLFAMSWLGKLLLQNLNRFSPQSSRLGRARRGGTTERSRLLLSPHQRSGAIRGDS